MKNNKVIISFILVLIIAFSFGCKDENKQKLSNLEGNTLIASSVLSGNASNLLAINCYVCHDPKSSSHDELLAPPLAGIKQRYMKATGTRSAFIERMTSFVSNPTKENAIMKGPVDRFGLMPKTALDKEQIEAIVTYIYENEIPAPSWFAGHEKQMGRN